MRLKRILLSLTAFVLALSSALPAGAEAFTIPTGSTKSCRKNETPVNAWWPNGGNSSNASTAKALGIAAVNDKLWVLTVNGSVTNPASYTMNILNSTTFAREGTASMSGVTAGTEDVATLYGLVRMGNAVISINRPSSYWQNFKVYCWEGTGAPTVMFNNHLNTYLKKSMGRGLGAIGTPSNGKIYVLSSDRGSVAIFTVTNKKIEDAAGKVTLVNLAKAPGMELANIEPLSDGSFWVKDASNNTYGMHFRADGTLIEEFSGDGFANANGSGQRHFTFKGQKLALCMNFTSGWADPRLSLIDYTAGVGSGKQKNIISGTQPQLSTHSQGSINITGCDYEIKTADKHLVLYGLDCDGGIVRVEYKETSAPGIVQNFTATARWEGAGQKVDLTWAKDGNATSYKVFKNSDDLETATEVWSGNDTKCTLDLTLGTGLAHKYSIKGYNEGGESAQSAYASTFDAGFGAVNLEGTIDPNDTKKAKLSWNAPAHGTLQGFEVIKRETKNGSDNSSVTTDTKIADLASDVTTYDYPNYTALVTTIENGITYNTSTRFLVRAKMGQAITTEKGERTDEVLSNAVAPNVPNTPYFTSIVTYKGRRTVALTWEVSSTTNLKYYEVYRDGIKILSNYEGSSYIDAELPDGNYSYVVKAYYDEGGETVVKSSLPGEASITYSPDVTNYILDCIYDYPIMTQDEWTAAGSPADAVVAKGWFANARSNVGLYGAPGDVYRQAQFYNGKWYIAQLTARTELISGELGGKTKWFIPNNYSDGLPTGTTSEKYKNDWKGHIYSIGADAATIKTIGNAGDVVNDTYGLENQSIAVDGTGKFWHRVTNSGPLNSTNLYYRPIKYLKGNIELTYGGHDFYYYEEQGKGANGTQYYRTHYLAAGNYNNGNPYVLLSMNLSADVYRVDLNAAGTAMSNITKFVAPYEGMTNPKTGEALHPKGSTENYSFPVPGRNGAFIQTVRSIGTWYVDPSGHYSLMYDATADITQSGGVAFTYNDEFFVLHPSTVRSNNPGYFRIDVAERGEGETAATVVPSKNNLIPCVGNKLEEVSQFVAGNSNCSWYGAEYDTADDCIYIYQYVPGVRFAKYRLYKRDAYPDVPVNINITTGYDNETNPSDITRFDCKITWNRPSKKPTDQDHSFGLPGADIVVDHYEVALKDQNGTVLETWKNKKDEADVNYVFTIDYSQNASGEFFINADKYTAEIVPIYKRVNNGTLIRGGMNYEVDQNDYPAAIGEARAYIYSGDGAAAGTYRVDLDFDRATAANSNEPVSYFLVEYSTDGGNTFNTLNKFNLLKQGEDYHHYPVEITTGQVPGNYKFGGGDTYKFGSDTPSEKGYALREKANPGDHKCVLYYYTTTNPSGFKYRITAVYASTNARIRKTASTNAENFNGGTTGIGDATGYSLSVYPVPATTAVTVTSPEAIESVRIFSTAGAEVAHVAGEKDYTQSVDVSTLAPGVYLLVVNEQAPLRIVKK
ncbi:MAG: T9SS type A sorting domain-containing protein [Muribaculaceae bacterium]|nr:T9SS type A sorting domain-containing protein [Bacteroidales bacterium]MDY6186067.1 T9SS type A sorting domain-containing protein [Muribaculaceae bacterium]